MEDLTIEESIDDSLFQISKTLERIETLLQQQTMKPWPRTLETRRLSGNRTEITLQ